MSNYDEMRVEQDTKQEAQQNYDRASTERMELERRNAEENQRREETMRQDENRRQAETRADEERRRQDRFDKELREAEETRQAAQRINDKLHDTTVQTLKGHDRNEEELPKNGQVWVDGKAIVADYYKNYDPAAQRMQHMDSDQQEEYREFLKSKEQEKEKPQQGEGKELSPAMQKIKEYEKSVADKVKEQLEGKTHSQSKSFGKTK